MPSVCFACAVMGEIDEREQFLSQMKQYDSLTKDVEKQVKSEISTVRSCTFHSSLPFSFHVPLFSLVEGRSTEETRQQDHKAAFHQPLVVIFVFFVIKVIKYHS
jgi:hypothetical protein